MNTSGAEKRVSMSSMPSARSGLLSSAGVYLLSNVANAAIPFALLPLLTRYLAPAEYGEVAMFQTLLGALGAFVGCGLVGAAARKFYDDGSADLADFMAACLKILAVSTAAVLALATIFSRELSSAFSLEPRWLLWAVAVSASTVVVQLRLSQWQVRCRPAMYGGMQVSQGATNMILSVLFVVVLGWGAAGRMTGQIIAALVFAFLAAVLLRRDGLFPFRGGRNADLRAALAFGAPLIPHEAGTFFLTSVDRVIINTRLGLHEAGIYMVAVQLAGGLGLVLASVQNAYVPWLYERLKRDDAKEKAHIVMRTYAWFATLAITSIAAFAVGPVVVPAIAGPQYTEAASVLGWLVLGQALQGMYLMVTAYVFYARKTGLLSFSTLISGAANIALMFALIPILGLLGASIAYCLAMLLRFVLTWRAACVSHPMPWFQFRKNGK